MKNTIVVLLILAATVAGAADLEPVAPFEVQVSTTVTGVTVATWNTGTVGAWQLNSNELELWVIVSTDQSAKRIRWQATPAGRGVMVVDFVGMPIDCKWQFNLRNIRTGHVTRVLWSD